MFHSKNMITRIKILLIGLMFIGCSLDIPIEDKISDPNAIVDLVSAEQCLSTAYSSISALGNIPIFSAMSDEFMPSPYLAKEKELYDAYHWKEDYIVELSENIWQTNYKTIVYINSLLERLPTIKGTVDNDGLHKVEIEAKALKALCYFNLLRLYTPRYQENKNKQPGIIIKNKDLKEEKPRLMLVESVDEIRNLLKDYLEAPNPRRNKSKLQISKLAANCLAVKLEMWINNFQGVVDICKHNLPKLSEDIFSESNYSKLWDDRALSSDDCIFSIENSQYGFFHSWNTEGGDALVVNEDVVFDYDDVRRKFSVIPFDFPINYGMSSRKVNLFGKYNMMLKKHKNITTINYFRMSDLLLDCSEAYSRLGNVEEAVLLLNKFLKGRGVKPIENSISKTELIKKIIKERKKEFLGEGRWFFELKRMGLSLKRNSIFEKYSMEISPDDYRWTFPIPASEIKYNRVKQNDGWEHLSYNL